MLPPCLLADPICGHVGRAGGVDKTAGTGHALDAVVSGIVLTPIAAPAHVADRATAASPHTDQALIALVIITFFLMILSMKSF